MNVVKEEEVGERRLVDSLARNLKWDKGYDWLTNFHDFIGHLATGVEKEQYSVTLKFLPLLEVTRK